MACRPLHTGGKRFRRVISCGYIKEYDRRKRFPKGKRFFRIKFSRPGMTILIRTAVQDR